MGEQKKLRYVDTDRDLFKNGVGRDAVAAFIYSANVLFGGDVCSYSEGVRTVAYGGEIYLPCEFFTRFLGASLNGNELVLGDKS